MGFQIDNRERVQVWVSPRLKDVLAAIQKEIALKVKKDFGLEEITITGTVASDALAARYLGDKALHFKIRKQNMSKGLLEFTERE